MLAQCGSPAKEKYKNSNNQTKKNVGWKQSLPQNSKVSILFANTLFCKVYDLAMPQPKNKK